MNWFTGHFLNERLLLGALAAAVPVAIHLFNKARYDIRGWGAMMFVEAAVDARASQIRMQQWLLLLLRCLFFGLLAVAMSRPVAHMLASDDVDHQPTTLVLIIDASGSTRGGDGETTTFDEIRRTALSIVNTMGPDDDVLVVRAGVKATALYPAPLSDKEFVSRKIQAMEAGYGKARMPEALVEAILLLNESEKSRRQVLILTDDQAISWPTANSQEWEEAMRVRTFNTLPTTLYVLPHPSRIRTPNMRISQIRQDFPIVDVYRRNRFTVDVINAGPRRRTRLDLHVGGNLESERELDLQEGMNAVNFDVTFQHPGSSHLRAVMPGDGLEADNVAVLAAQVVKRIPILVIEGKSASHPLSSDGGCLRMALTAAASEASESLLEVTVRNQTSMDEMDAAFLSGFKTIMLANVTSLSIHFRLRLERYVQQGGGLFIALGADVDPDNYNVMFREKEGLLPALLKGVAPPLDSTYVPVINAADSPIFTDIRVDNESMLKRVRIRRFHATTAATDARVLASCNEFPLLLYKGFGKGQVVMWTGSLTPDWSNLPMTDDFLPLMQNVAVVLSGSISPPINLALGETLYFNAGPSGKKDLAQTRDATVELPSGEKVTIPVTFDDGQWVGRFEDTTLPGLYTVRLPDAAPFHYAVQLEPDEGDLTPLDDDRQLALTNKLGAQFLDTLNELNARVSQEQPPSELWVFFLVAALALLTAELILGNRYS